MDGSALNSPLANRPQQFLINSVESNASACCIEPSTFQVAAAPWWLPVKGADWRHPEGVDSDIAGRCVVLAYPTAKV